MQYAEKLGVSSRRIEQLCAAGRIAGAARLGTGGRAHWMIPANAPDPRQAPGRPAANKKTAQRKR